MIFASPPPTAFNPSVTSHLITKGWVRTPFGDFKRTWQNGPVRLEIGGRRAQEKKPSFENQTCTQQKSLDQTSGAVNCLGGRFFHHHLTPVRLPGTGYRDGRQARSFTELVLVPNIPTGLVCGSVGTAHFLKPVVLAASGC